MATISLQLTDEQRALENGVTEICKRYPGDYWRELDAQRAYPEKFVDELTRAGYLAALIPQEYGGAGLPLRDGALILETIHANGGSAGACHAQMYIMSCTPSHRSRRSTTSPPILEPPSRPIGPDGWASSSRRTMVSAERCAIDAPTRR